MSLRRKILVKDAALLLGLSLMIAGSLWGLLRQREHVRASLNELSALHLVESAQANLLAFQQRVHAGSMNDADALAQLRAASLELRRYKAVVSQYKTVLPPEITPELQALLRTQTKQAVSDVVALVTFTDTPAAGTDSARPDPAVIAAQVDQLARDVGALLAMCNGFIARTATISDRDLRTATAGVVTVAGVLLLGSVIASLWQHRRMTVPLDRLRQWCRRTAAGDFSVPYQPSGDREFQDLARDVNRMAADLNAFYRRLEAMVATKSRELVRSERLASIGYLAAGVAHEINTPLNVMSGYAELSLRRLARAESNVLGGDELTEHLSIIRGEAFRCKEITQKLLSLARGGGADRAAVDCGAAVADVAVMVRALPIARHKRLILTPAQGLLVWGNTTEIRQVLLNLVVNAIEAVTPGTGEVTISARPVDGSVEISITDNGRGMSEAVREQVFEPFFTDKRGVGEPGTGLGLSVTHAIVVDHGGRITAHSDGPARGSRFTLILPAAEARR